MTKAAKALLLLALAAAANAVAKPGDEGVTGEILSYGLYELLGSEELRSAPDTAVGKALVVEGYEHLATTSEVPLQLGVSFGYEYRLRGLDAVIHDQVIVRIVHPPITGDDGQVRTESTDVSDIEPVSGEWHNFLTYRFSEPRELQAGRWTFQILRHGRPLVSKEFTVR